MLKPLTFVISAENQPDLLARTVMQLHRLCIPVNALSMQRPLDSPTMRITIEVLSEPERSERIAANLAKVVHVVSTESRRRKARSIRKPRLPTAEIP